MRVSGGSYVDLNNFNMSDVSITDIAVSLSRQVRFSGHGPLPPLTVLQHSMLVSKLCPKDLKMEGLLHDAHEAYLGDITTPVKNHLGVDDDGTYVMHAVRTVFGLTEDEKQWKRVRHVDLVSLDIERRMMWPSSVVDDKYWPKVQHEYIPSFHWKWAKQQNLESFMNCYEELK